jgi:hypothetical protein
MELSVRSLTLLLQAWVTYWSNAEVDPLKLMNDKS